MTFIQNQKLKYKNPKLDMRLFWDVDKSKIDFKKNYDSIISRVINLGTIEDIISLSNLYGDNNFKNLVKKCKCIEKTDIDFVSSIFNIPKEKLYCYKHQSYLTKV